MACGGCYGARQMFYSAARRMDVRGAVAAIQRGVSINVDKVRGTYRDENYATPPNITKAQPYKRPPERST